MIADRWGVTVAEVGRHYPCDDLVARPAWSAWRGVDVAAPPSAVWPWVAQLRLAPYSYDWIDNLGRRSPRDLRGLPDPVPGDPFTAAAGRPIGRVTACEPGVHLTGTILGTAMSYVLVPISEARSRLLLKLVGARFRPLGPVLCAGDLVMARRQLRTLASLAEGA
ncbi:MAG: polyketide cyclase [Sporichthyaceae bacterium]